MAIVPQISNFVKGLKKNKLKKKTVSRIGKSLMWFTLGAVLGFFFFTSFLYIIYQKTHTNKAYEGVIINGIDFSGRSYEEIKGYFDNKNAIIRKSTLTLTTPQATSTIAANQIDFGYDAPLLARQAVTIGRSDNILSNMSLMYQAYTQNISLSASYHFSEQKFEKLIAPLVSQTNIETIDPLFNFVNNKVVTLREGKDGQKVDEAELKRQVLSLLQSAIQLDKPEDITIAVPIQIVPAAVAEDKADSMGIKEEIGTGTSLFHGSIEARAFNINLAASRLNGTVIKPGETFSFDKTVGDISSLNGYKQAYVIQNGKTVLGDGGGVCQVSTTLFRAALNAGLPIVERNAHAYRVGYYEQDSGPGIDAAIYTPNIDLKFKNDTNHHILIQSYVDLDSQQITFTLYGTKDNREVTMTKPVVVSETPAPEPSFQDDPTLPKGQVKQIDFSANGAKVYFTRTVKKDGKTIISERFDSNYRPWQAIYLRGTQ